MVLLYLPNIDAQIAKKKLMRSYPFLLMAPEFFRKQNVEI